jgi:Heparinase II/III-like protein
LAASDALIGRQSWWPAVAEDFRSCLFAELRSGGTGPIHFNRPDRRPNIFRDAGLAILRDVEPRGDELWCRCDHGPHGYLSIAAHAHADALSVELRHGGVDILADPGTYCYCTEPDFRRFFRSTIGHNTLEIGGANQARYGGPFLWLDAPESTLLAVDGLDSGPVASWTASHKGYVRQSGRPVHVRRVMLDRVDRRLRIIDHIEASGELPVRLAFHLGSTVTASLEGNTACLTWPQGDERRGGRLVLPGRLSWRAFRGSMAPICGWYSPAFGERVPTTSLIGEGMLSSHSALETVVEIEERPLDQR